MSSSILKFHSRVHISPPNLRGHVPFHSTDTRSFPDLQYRLYWLSATISFNQSSAEDNIRSANKKNPLFKEQTGSKRPSPLFILKQKNPPKTLKPHVLKGLFLY
jgi:hypothetical protein